MFICIGLGELKEPRLNLNKSQEDYIQKTKTAFKIPTYLLTNLYYKTNENTYICDRLLKYTEWKIRTKARDHENKKEIKKKNRKTTKNKKIKNLRKLQKIYKEEDKKNLEI